MFSKARIASRTSHASMPQRKEEESMVDQQVECDEDEYRERNFFQPSNKRRAENYSIERPFTSQS